MKKYTPMIEQYLEIKKDYADSLVFFRLGDFYEMFFDDAVTAARELEIVLTARDGGVEEKIPMCGVPHHSVLPYIEKLINKGYKVAIAEQITEPGKGLVEREVVKLITPGMVIDDGILGTKDNNYIGSIGQKRVYFSLCYADVSTGEFYLIEDLRRDALDKEINKLGLKELVLSKDLKYLEKYLNENLLISYQETEVKKHPLFKDLQKAESVDAAALLLSYLTKIEKNLDNIFAKIEISNKNEFLQLDKRSVDALELTESPLRVNHSLFKVLDKCETAMGSRLLKKMIVQPLTNKEKIDSRLNFVEVLRNSSRKMKELKETLKGVYDLKRISSRIASENSTPKDLSQLQKSLSRLPIIIEALEGLNNKKISEYANSIDIHSELENKLKNAITENPPLTIKDGGIFKLGYNEKLDKYYKATKEGEKWLNDFEEREREKTGIKNLKVGFNRVFGYYIEITKGNISLVQDEFGYVRKQTLVNSERFINEELKEQEELILEAEEKSLDLEYELFLELRKEVATYAGSLQLLADQIAYIDVMQSLALVSLENNYVKPEIKADRELFISNGRHPTVEHFHNEPFIANDVSIIDGGILLITGPNMSGKSTYMRTVALIVIMAQMGSFVPADVAKVPIYDAIYTRIGAQDDLTRGQSTFMVEMLETNEALRNATPNSLLIFDEIGRGTATYDGMALAQGIIEYVHEAIKAGMLFSTHYHELTKLETVLKRVKNVHVSAVLEKGKLLFLYKVKEGPTDKSYGINVAALAKLPKALINRSQDILDHLEVDKRKDLDLNIFNYDIHEQEKKLEVFNEVAINKIKELDIDSLTPIEALLILKELQEEIK